MALIPIILSGGAGTRLWPLSRESAPKPFMTLPGDGVKDAACAHRCASGRAARHRRAGHDHPPRPLLRGQGRVREREPRASGAYRVSAGAFRSQYRRGGRPGRALRRSRPLAPTRPCSSLPSDHLIRDQAAFAAAVGSAAALAREGWLATFGIAPTRPETGYGYLELGEALAIPDAFRVRRFVEKPPLGRGQPL